MSLIRRRRVQSDRATEPGQDSFLDVVANLIGILIILVMLIGSQAQTVWQKMRAERQTSDAEIEQLEQGIQKAKDSVTNLKVENRELESSINRHSQVTQRLRKERDQIQLAVYAVKEAITEKGKKLNAQQRENQQLVANINYLQQELASIEGKTESLKPAAPKLGVIDHLPTPIAKTVFGEEVHFRLSGDRIVHVPLNELVLLMRSEWKVKAKKLMQTPSTIETVGPVDQFRMQYKLILREQVQRTEHGVIRSMVPGLERFILLPTQENLGETFDQALTPNSQFLQRLASLDPSETTISVWVYPDSFGRFNQLKKLLYDKGFLCAGWPLPENQPISGSPNGFRTAAQ